MVVIEALLSGTPVVATASTPFYQELMLDGILARDLRSVPMPDRVRKQAGPNLRLEQPEIDAIGELLLEAVLGTPPPDSAGRILRSGRALLAGLYEDRMLSELARYYAGVLATGDAPQAADAIRWLQ
jgi:glycosyltransferase involved in cell wall biosynthesis